MTARNPFGSLVSDSEKEPALRSAMNWAAIFQTQQHDNNAAPPSARNPLGANLSHSDALFSAASALASSNLNFTSGTLASSAASLLQHLEEDSFLGTQSLPLQQPQPLSRVNPSLSLRPELGPQFLLQNSTQGSSGHSTSQASFQGKPHPRTPDGLAASSMVSSWKSPANTTFPSHHLPPEPPRPTDTAQHLFHSLQAKADHGIWKNLSSNLEHPLGDSADAHPKRPETNGLAGLSPEVLEALLVKSAGSTDLPASATSALLSQWLRDVEGHKGGRESDRGLSLAGGAALGASTQVPAQLLSHMLPGGAHSLMDGGLGACSLASGDHNAFTQEDVINLALAQLSSVQVEGELGKTAPQALLWGGLGGALASQGLPAGISSFQEPRDQSPQRREREASQMKSVTPSMSLSMDGSGRRGEMKTEEEKRRRKLALNREAARRMRQRQALRLEQLEKTVVELQAANAATTSRLSDAERKVSDLESRNEGLETCVVDVVQEILLHNQPSIVLKAKLCALTDCLSVNALGRMPEWIEGIRRGEVEEGRGRMGSLGNEHAALGEKRKSSPCKMEPGGDLLLDTHFGGTQSPSEDLDPNREEKRLCSGSSYGDESE